LALALLEMYVEGVLTRKVKYITEELCGTRFSKSTVSHLAARLDAERPLVLKFRSLKRLIIVYCLRSSLKPLY
jgi:transposase-like protein